MHSNNEKKETLFASGQLTGLKSVLVFLLVNAETKIKTEKERSKLLFVHHQQNGGKIKVAIALR